MDSAAEFVRGRALEAEKGFSLGPSSPFLGHFCPFSAEIAGGAHAAGCNFFLSGPFGKPPPPLAPPPPNTRIHWAGVLDSQFLLEREKIHFLCRNAVFGLFSAQKQNFFRRLFGGCGRPFRRP